jgi:hypothetical protein
MFPDDDWILVESYNIKMFIFEVTVVLYFIKILSGSRNFYRLRIPVTISCLSIQPPPPGKFSYTALLQSLACPFLRRKRHCVKGFKCDFSHTVDSHRPLQSGPRGFSSHFRVPSPYLGDFPLSVDSQRPLQFGPSGFPSPFREPSPYPGPLFPPAIPHPLMNHSYANPFIQTLQTLQPLMDMPTRTIR